MTELQAGSPTSPDIEPFGLPVEGSLTFVGAGPGDPTLLTLAGADALRGAEIVVVDNLDVMPFITQLELPQDPEVLLARDDDGAFIIEQAQSGRDVVRLVSGDLFIDCDLGVLVKALNTQRLRVDVIPGVSQFSATASYAGVASDVWACIDARRGVPSTWPQTPSLMIKVDALQLSSLTAGGRAEAEPILVVSGVGTTGQTSDLTTWLGLREVDADGEVMLVVGDAARSRDAHDWFESKPLFDWRVLIPVAKDQGGVISSRLTMYGALPEEVRTISIEPPRTEQQMEKAVRGLVDGRYRWIVFTSPNAVEAVRARFVEYGLDARAMSGIEVAAVGGSTARALAAWGIAADLMPVGQQTTVNLASNFPAFDDFLDPINRVLVPRAEISTDALLAGLEGLGWEVEDVTAYRTVRAAPPPAETREAIKTGMFDAVVFASSSTVRNLIGIAGKPHANTVVCAIGSATAQACIDHGLRVDAVAAEPTARALADTLAGFAAERRSSLIDQGLPVTKPSQRRRRRRRAK